MNSFVLVKHVTIATIHQQLCMAMYGSLYIQISYILIQKVYLRAYRQPFNEAICSECAFYCDLFNCLSDSDVH